LDPTAITLSGGRVDHHGAHGRLARGGGGLRGFERDAHCPVIMVHDPLRPQPNDPGQEHDSGEEGGGERVAKLLARSGVGSRRDVERLIGEGRVAINGRTLTTPAVKVEPGDILTVDGEVVGEPEPARSSATTSRSGLVTTTRTPPAARRCSAPPPRAAAADLGGPASTSTPRACCC
jgi:23S rRNA pseudouridine2605 synthase